MRSTVVPVIDKIGRSSSIGAIESSNIGARPFDKKSINGVLRYVYGLIDKVGRVQPKLAAKLPPRFPLPTAGKPHPDSPRIESMRTQTLTA